MIQVSGRSKKEAPGGAARRQPRQERSRATVEDILQAAAEVFGKLGYAGATTNKIAERAGVSIGSLYQYFASKDDILGALLAQHHRDVRTAIDAAALELADREVPLSRGLRGLLEGLLAVHGEDRALSHVLAREIHGPRGRRLRKADEGERYVDAVEEILDQRPEVRVEDTRMAAVVVVQTIEHLIRWLGHESPRSLDAGAFVDELLAMLIGYLTRAENRAARA